MTKLHRLLCTAAIIVSTSAVWAAGNAPQPSICTRGCWDARAASGISQMSALTRAIVHHTAGNEFNTTGFEASKADVRGIQNLHMNGNGWADIGYHFLVDKFGNIFEGRAGSMSSLPRGSHDATNTNSFGFNLMGYFHPGVNNVPTSAMMSSLYNVIAWRMPNGWSPYGSPGVYGELGNNVGRIDSHRRVKSTACPGDNVHNVYIGNNVNAGTIRSQVQARINGLPDASSGPDAVSWGPNRIDVVIRGADSALWHKYYNGSWSAWGKVGGNITSDPTICSWAPGRLDIFARGGDNALWHINYAGGWSAWQSLGGVIDGAPDACSWGSGHIDVVARGANDAAYWLTYDSTSGWGSWSSLGGGMNADPSICSWGPGRLDVFTRGLDNALWHKPFSGDAWGGWQDLGGAMTSGPDAVSWGTGRIDVVARGTGNHGLHRYYAGTWSAFGDIDGTFVGNLSVCSWGTGRLDVFGGGTDTSLWHNYYQSGWGTWQDLGGGLF